MKFRKKEKILKDNLNSRKIIFFIWPRQVWKTTILKKIFNELKTDKKLFLNLEILDYHEFFQSFEKMKELLLKNWFNEKEKFYLFLDEFHKVKNISWILKSLYDEFENIKIVVTWSNNIEINKNISESFSWRKRIINCYSLDFEEFLIWKENLEELEVEKYIKNPLNKWKIQFFLEEFLTFWWYPEVVKADTIEDKKQVFEDIFSFWLNKDIIPEVKKIYKFNSFLKQLAFRNWDLLNLNYISTDIWVSQPTAERFAYLLQESLLVYTVKPFFKNKLKEIVKMPKVYFSDIWFRNFLMNRFDFLQEEKWILFENFIFSEMIKSWVYHDNIKFWRLKNWSKEVDFILEDKNKAFEIKFKEGLKKSDQKWLKFFSQMYNDFEVKIISKNNFFDFI